jgi:hypothetical protein
MLAVTASMCVTHCINSVSSTRLAPKISTHYIIPNYIKK